MPCKTRCVLSNATVNPQHPLIPYYNGISGLHASIALYPAMGTCSVLHCWLGIRQLWETLSTAFWKSNYRIS